MIICLVYTQCIRAQALKFMSLTDSKIAPSVHMYWVACL